LYFPAWLKKSLMFVMGWFNGLIKLFNFL
jgi:hypothetical protein